MDDRKVHLGTRSRACGNAKWRPHDGGPQPLPWGSAPTCAIASDSYRPLGRPRAKAPSRFSYREWWMTRSSTLINCSRAEKTWRLFRCHGLAKVARRYALARKLIASPNKRPRLLM